MTLDKKPVAKAKSTTLKKAPAKSKVATHPVVAKVKSAVVVPKVVRPVVENKVEMNSSTFISTVGRRKRSIARIRLFANGGGKVTVNKVDLVKYFPTFYHQNTILQPLKLTSLENKVDISVKVAGGGTEGQVGAIRLGIARALLIYNSELRPSLRTAGFLTRDSRIKERKKPGLKKARRAPQFSKR